MPPSDTRIALPRYSECFVCGKNNSAGLDLTFYYHNGQIETAFTPEPHHAGYQDVTHGGLLATVLDECMGWTVILSRPILCVSVELSFRYRSKAQSNTPLLVRCQLEQDRKRMVFSKGTIEREDGTLVCEGEGKFVPLTADEMEGVARYAQWNGALEKVYQQIQADLAHRQSAPH